jgi:Leucine Rich repeat
VKAVFMSRLLGISGENLILIILSWLDIREYGLLDLALTNVVERKRWMICLSVAHLNSNLRTIQCTHVLIRWLIKRKMQPEVMICKGSYGVVDDLSFVGIDNKFLHTLGLFDSDITDDGLLMIAQGCPQLKDITLRDCKKISHKGLLALAVNLPGMTSIDVCLSSKMTSVSVTVNKTCVGVYAIAVRCPALVKISLLEGYRSRYAAVAINDSIQAIARGCSKLQTISIYDGYELSDKSVTFLAERCKELRSILLRRCDLVADGAIRAIANSCPDLEKLDLGGRRTDTTYISRITDASFIIVGQNCSKLVDISIAYNNVTDIGIAALSRGCPKLQSFSANNCPSISTAGITALSHRCKELRTINLVNCRRISDDCLFRIAEGCPELTSFTLSGSKAVTNAGISCIAGSCEKLTSITISNCSQIDDKALIAIGFSCPALESISIKFSPKMTDAGMIILAQNCLQLKSITIHNSKITDASLIAFATNSHQLQSVSFHHCYCTTSTGLSHLAAKCTQMEKISFKRIYDRKVGYENLLSLRRIRVTAQLYQYMNAVTMVIVITSFILCT